MAIGDRMRAIRLQHGHSLDEAAAITGINRSTLHRLEQGEKPRRIMEHVRRFGLGYGVKESILLDDQSVKGRFESLIRKQDPSGRLSLAAASLQGRLKVVLDFITHEQPDAVDLRRLAVTTALPVREVEQALRSLRIRPVDHATLVALVEGLHGVTGISRRFLLTGWFEEEAGITRAIGPLVSRLKDVPGLKGTLSTSELVRQVSGSLLA